MNKPILNAIDIAVVNVKRLYRLKAKGKFLEKHKREFEIYKQILVSNDTGVYTDEVNYIIYS